MIDFKKPHINWENECHHERNDGNIDHELNISF